MSTAALPISTINGQPLAPEQANYLTGFFAGVAARGQRFTDAEAAPAVGKTVSHEDLLQLYTRPVISLNPYKTPAQGIYICSSSTPPGGGVHGLCGYFAAQAALRDDA